MLEKVIAGILIGTALSLGSCSKDESADYIQAVESSYVDNSTPESALKSYIKATKEGDLEKILILKGHTNEEIRKVKNTLPKEGLEVYRAVKEISKNQTDVHIDIVKTQYLIYKGEEVACVEAMISGFGTSRGFGILANHYGRWVVINAGDSFPEEIGFNLYDNPTSKNKGPSKLVEKLKKEYLSEIEGTPPTSQKYKETPQEESNNLKDIKYLLRELIRIELIYRVKNDKYGSLEELAKADYINENDFKRNKDYKIELIKLDKENYAFRAIPINREKTGSTSYYIDQVGYLRKADNSNVNEASEIVNH